MVDHKMSVFVMTDHLNSDVEWRVHLTIFCQLPILASTLILCGLSNCIQALEPNYVVLKPFVQSCDGGIVHETFMSTGNSDISECVMVC